LAIIPFINIISLSISSPEAVERGQVTLWPKGFSGEAIVAIIQSERFLRSFGNSVYYMVLGTAISLVMTALCAYPLTKEFPGKRIFLAMMIITLFFGGGMIPNYILITRLGMIDTVWALVLPGAISAYYVFIMQSYFKSIGNELEDAAKIDGSSEIGILFNIIIPLSMPVFATIGLFYAVGSWNSFTGPLIYMTSRDKYTLQIFLRDLVIQSSSLNALDEAMAVKFITKRTITQFKYAAIIISIVPVLFLYPVLQKHFTKGFTLGALKQ
ncbi:MAG: carbohydrate ABC transporter permease, partial [Clostridiaceae bacterium]|nr:carbohydrate ABC transporter permease [Clostridiaceae bacterium]